MNCWLKDNCNGKDCDKFCLRKYKLDCLYAEALLDDAQKQHVVLSIDSDGTDREEFTRLANIEQNILDFVAEHQNLYIHSSICGNGKSSWAVRIITSYLNKIWAGSELTCRALFISVPNFLLASKDKISTRNEYFEHIKENYLAADIVVWDDIAAKTATDYEINQLLSMIDARINAGKTNIFTSNLNPAQMSVALGERITSRVCDNSIDIELHGSCKRPLKYGGAKKW